MQAIWARQSELSIASAVFYFIGGVIALALVTVLLDPTNPLNVVSLLTSALSFFLMIVFLVVGRRATERSALLLMCLSAAMVLLSACLTPRELRAINSGLLFYPIIMYLVWFGRRPLARIFGSIWLMIYCLVVWAKFGADIAPFLLTLALTSLVLSELIGLYKDRLEATSLTDPLCDVWNKRGFEAVMSRAIRISARTKQPISVLYFDLDDLKRVNDTQGHSAGDRLLQDFARQVDLLTRPEDELARLGGDEFALLMPGSDALAAETVALRLREQTTASAWSFGVAQMEPGESPEEFLARADQLMFEEKRRRKADREITTD